MVFGNKQVEVKELLESFTLEALKRWTMPKQHLLTVLAGDNDWMIERRYRLTRLAIKSYLYFQYVNDTKITRLAGNSP